VTAFAERCICCGTGRRFQQSVAPLRSVFLCFYSVIDGATCRADTCYSLPAVFQVSARFPKGKKDLEVSFFQV
jgi:hypothetical protein